MEPTIYKPSIYKGAGIYKTGAEGGGGAYIKEINFSSDVRQSTFPTKTIYIKDNRLYKESSDNSGIFLNKLPFDTANEFEFNFKYKLKADTSTYSQIFGDFRYFWRGPTLWKSPLETDIDGIVFAVPTGSDNWTGNLLQINVSGIVESEIETNFTFNNNTRKLHGIVYKDGVIIGEDEITTGPVDYSRMGNHLLLNCGYTNPNQHYFKGSIDLEKSYIKIDGERYF